VITRENTTVGQRVWTVHNSMYWSDREVYSYELQGWTLEGYAILGGPAPGNANPLVYFPTFEEAKKNLVENLKDEVQKILSRIREVQS
jgi:hypothetical protein